jgi:hypothetical protein
MFKNNGEFVPFIAQTLQQQLSVQAVAPAIGPSGNTAGLPSAAIPEELYISAYTAPPGTNALVVGDKISNASGNFALVETGTAVTQVTSSGVLLAAAGESTLAPVDFVIHLPSSHAKVNLLALASDGELRGAARVVNINNKHWDGAISKAFLLVLGCNPTGTVDAQGIPGWRITGQPFGLDREILVVV